MVQVLHLTILLFLFQALVFGHYSIFLYKSICSTMYKVSAVPMRVCSTHEAHPHYLCGCSVPVRHTLSTHERLLMNGK